MSEKAPNATTPTRKAGRRAAQVCPLSKTGGRKKRRKLRTLLSKVVLVSCTACGSIKSLVRYRQTYSPTVSTTTNAYRARHLIRCFDVCLLVLWGGGHW